MPRTIPPISRLKRTFELYIDTEEKRCWQKATLRLKRLAVCSLLMEKPMRWTELKRKLNLTDSTLYSLLRDMIIDGLIEKQYNKKEDHNEYILVDKHL